MSNFKRIIDTNQHKFMYTDENILIEEPGSRKKSEFSSLSSITQKRQSADMDSLDYLGRKDSVPINTPT